MFGLFKKKKEKVKSIEPEYEKQEPEFPLDTLRIVPVGTEHFSIEIYTCTYYRGESYYWEHFDEYTRVNPEKYFIESEMGIELKPLTEKEAEEAIKEYLEYMEKLDKHSKVPPRIVPPYKLVKG